MSESWKALQETMLELGIEPKRSLGQNFLVSDHVIQKILAAVVEAKPEAVVEIGPGLGALTRGLMPLKPTLLELDKTFVGYWRGKGLEVIEGDALQLDWKSFYQKFSVDSKMPYPFVLVSNLPYQISSSIVIDRSIEAVGFDTMILMFQKEVAQRMKATHQSSNYGMLSVVAQSFWKIETLLEASSHDFHPPPKVASRVLVFHRIPTVVEDRRQYLKFVKACFLQPRKLMVSNLQQGLSLSREISEKALKDMGRSEKSRAGELKVSEFIDFYHRLGYK